MRYILLILLGMLLLLFTDMSVQAQEGNAVPLLTLDMRNVSLIDVLKEIEDQSGMNFSYESSILKGIPEVSLTVQKEPLDSCLYRLFAALPLLYQIKGRYIILKRQPKQITLSGFILDQSSAESLIGASVYDMNTRAGTASNNHGFFSIKLSPGDVVVHISYIGYKNQLLNFPRLDRDTVLSIELEPNAALQEVIVEGRMDQEKNPVLNTQMGALEFNQRAIQATPVMFGEADIIKTLQSTPGVAVGTEGFAGMYVRGGNVDENLFLIDGNPIYQVNHVGGIFSAFNTEAIRGIEFLKAGFPSRYGGRLSSVVDIHTKEGNMKEFHGKASIGLVAGNIHLEGPLVKDKTSFMISLRRTWLDALTAPAFAIVNHYQKKHGDKTNFRYAFHDLNLKLNHRFNDRSRIFVSLYNGHDVLKGSYKEFSSKKTDYPYRDETRNSLRWGNLMATAGWTYVFNNQLFGKFSGVYTRYNSIIKQTAEKEYGVKGEEDYSSSFNDFSTKTGISDFGFRSLFDYIPSNSHRIRFGSDLLIHRFRPEYNRVKGKGEAIGDALVFNTVYSNDLLWAKECALFAEDDWHLSHSVRLSGGLRYTFFHIDSKAYMSLEPRLSMRWLLSSDVSLKASYSRMNQYVHLVSSSFINLPTDAWMPVTKRLKPQVSDQFTVGAYYNRKGKYDFSIEGYYKKMENLLEYKSGYSFLPTFSSWEDKMARGEGRAYGAEFMIQKKKGKTTGWAGYTLAWSDRKFKGINKGKRFPAKYDNRHKLNLVVMHKLSSKIELSAAWTYTTGNRLTLSLENYGGTPLMTDFSSYYVSGEYAVSDKYSPIVLDYIEERNNFRLPAYHRLDLGINIYRPKKGGRMGIWNVSIYNAYNRMNPFMVYKSTKKVLKPGANPGGYYSLYEYIPCFKQVGIMPIIPSVTYTYKF